MLGEVFDHVVALGFTVHQHVQAQVFLDLHGVTDLAVHRFGVFGFGQLALFERLASQTDRRGLRERTDGGGREQRQVQAGALFLDALGKRRMTLAVLGGDGGNTRLHSWLMNAWRCRTAGLHGAAVSQRFKHLRRFRFIHRLSQHRDFFTLLHGKRQPAFQFGIELVFTPQINRAVQQRAGWRDPQTFTQTFLSVLQCGQSVFQIAAPDVTAVDHAQRQHFVGRQAIEDGRVLLRCAHQIDVQAVHRQVGGQAQVLFQATEVSGDQLLQRVTLNQVVGTFKGVFPFLWQVENQDRFVDLHPLDALCRQALEDLAVQRQKAIQQLQLVEFGALGLAQPQVSQRADDHRLDVVPQCAGFFNFFEQLVPTELELLIGAEFRDEVVIVGVEPLGHFLGVCAAAAAVAHTARHAEQGLQAGLAIVRAETLRDHTEHQRVGQDLVVPGEVADRQQLDTGLFLQVPVGLAQVAAHGAQTGFVEFALPERLLSLFQFAVATNARKTKGMGHSHVK
ncbi:hypothetical protein D3C86_1246530 [compost metagenome]